ncbi:MAG: PilN domain-containing protein [Phycisphaerales bacterium]|nr:PilN domain-containing protein [Phycisphaerales bacterium]
MSQPNENPTQGGSFLPQEYVKGKSQVRANIMALFLFSLVLAGVIGAFVVNHQRWSRVHEEQKVVAAAFEEEASKISQLEGLEKQRVELLERAEVVTALKDRVPRSVLLGEIVRSIPKGLTLTVVNLEGERVKVVAPEPDPKAKAAKTRTLKGKSVGNGKDAAGDKEPPKVLPPKFKFSLSAEGIAQENDNVADFLSAIKNSPLFGDVELQFINQTTIDKEQYRKFKVTMSLLHQADASLVDGTEKIEIGNVDFGIAGSDTDSE